MPTKSKAKATKGLNKKQLAHLEKRLLEERGRVMKELGYYDESFNSSLQASDGDLSSYSFHMADQGTDAMEREKAFLFASQEGRYLWHVNQDRKSTRLNSSHSQISYAVFCLKKKRRYRDTLYQRT